MPGLRAWLRDPAHIFWVLFSTLTLVRLWIGWRLPLFGDEAFYAWEAAHPALAYSDLPGLTAALAALGQLLPAEGSAAAGLALRLPFLLLALAVPLLMVRVVAVAGWPHWRWQIGTAGLLLPLLATNGLLALPEPPLLLAAMLCLLGCLHLLRDERGIGAGLLVLGLVLGALSHYRFAMVLLAGGTGLLLSRDGRRLLARPWMWLLLLAGALAWMPLLLFNLEHAQAGLRFQMVDRHPWQFQWQGLLHLPVQIVVTTPLLYLLLLWAGVRGLRSPTAPAARLLAGAGLIPVLAYFVLGLFADSERVSFHWPLVGYLALLPLLAPLLQRSTTARRVWPWALSLAACGSALLLLYLLMLGSAAGREQVVRWRLGGDNFIGWNRIGERVRALQAEEKLPLLADNFMLAAQLRFATAGEQPVWTLDHPLNHKHGRALQLSIWSSDEAAAMAAHAGQPVLLVMEETALSLRLRPDWLREVCGRFDRLRLLEEVVAAGDRKRFLLYRATLPASAPARADCELPAQAYIGVPSRGEKVSGMLQMRGWAFQDGAGVARVEVMIDGVVVGEPARRRREPGVLQQWPKSTDPDHPNVGFEAGIDVSDQIAGRRWLSLRVTGRDGRVRELAGREIELR